MKIRFDAERSDIAAQISFTTETSMRALSAGLLFTVGHYEVHEGRCRPASF